MWSLRERIKDAALDVGLGRKYGHTGDDTQDCVRLTFAILKMALPQYPWDKGLYAMMIRGSNKWSNTDYVVSTGAGVLVNTLMPGHWHYVQGWGKRGHNVLIWCPERITDPLWILEASNVKDDWYRIINFNEWCDRYDEVRIVALLEGGGSNGTFAA